MGINLAVRTRQPKLPPLFTEIDHESREVLLLLEKRIPRSWCVGVRSAHLEPRSDARTQYRFGFREERCEGLPILYLKVRPP